MGERKRRPIEASSTDESARSWGKGCLEALWLFWGERSVLETAREFGQGSVLGSHYFGISMESEVETGRTLGLFLFWFSETVLYMDIDQQLGRTGTDELEAGNLLITSL